MKSYYPYLVIDLKKINKGRLWFWDTQVFCKVWECDLPISDGNVGILAQQFLLNIVQIQTEI